MKIKKQVTDRVIKRFNKIVKVAAVVFIGSYLADSSILSIISSYDSSETVNDDSMDTAFYESAYGDFE